MGKSAAPRLEDPVSHTLDASRSIQAVVYKTLFDHQMGKNDVGGLTETQNVSEPDSESESEVADEPVSLVESNWSIQFGVSLVALTALLSLLRVVDHGGESRITAGLKKYACFLTLDPNTANKRLILSEENRNVTNVDNNQSYPDHPDRFDYWCQVLCRESVCGRCYWEIEWSRRVEISVSYKSISRKGRGVECVFGFNDQSWSLICSHSRYSFTHNKRKNDLHVKPIISSVGVSDNIYRVGVYVDVSAGTLSFYSVSDTMSLIHTEQTTFTQPLYHGFYLNNGSSVKLC
ncbi:Stonustoxin subunit beta [Labeo rohita]|uniref:Stonustoxin subunit beta n=1 Tax=Labeo rohita TaxID=84645 RepID=A0ABQ8L2X6_LABRO|nr:Stonustoxin subunit beta [Labeo rohita]